MLPFVATNRPWAPYKSGALRLLVWTVGDSTIVDQGVLNFFYEAPGA